MATPGDSIEQGGPTPAETLRYEPRTAEGRLLVKLCTWLDPATPDEDIFGYPAVERRRPASKEDAGTSDAFRACTTLKDRQILTFNNYFIIDHIRLENMDPNPDAHLATHYGESLASLQAGNSILDFGVRPAAEFTRHPLDKGGHMLLRPSDLSLRGFAGRTLVQHMLGVNIQAESERIAKQGWKHYEVDLRAEFNERLAELGCSPSEAVVWKWGDNPPQPSTPETQLLAEVLDL